MTIDRITAPWVQVRTTDGNIGWCFSGYLQEVQKKDAQTPQNARGAAPAQSSDMAQVLEGSWSSTPSIMVGIQFFLSEGEVSTTTLNFSGNRYSIWNIQGFIGLGSSQASEGTFKVNTRNKTLDLIDAFGAVARYKYVLSESEELMELKLKDSRGDITTWYKSK
jgi:hypothetical protein